MSDYSASISLAVICILLGLGWVTTNTDARYETDTASEALAGFPRQLGDSDGIWLAVRDVPIPSSQERMLDLSSHLSREFRRLGSFPPVTATLFIAYCADARTMAGHHPPHCYPASGWMMQGEETMTSTVVRGDDRIVNYSVYQFRRDPTSKTVLTVVSGFFNRPEFFAATLEEATESIGPVFFGRKGLFQFQILFQGLHAEADVTKYTDELIQGIPSAVFDLAFGRGKTEAPVAENVRGAEL